jgi:hypothetical protein
MTWVTGRPDCQGSCCLSTIRKWHASKVGGWYRQRPRSFRYFVPNKSVYMRSYSGGPKCPCSRGRSHWTCLLQDSEAWRSGAPPPCGSAAEPWSSSPLWWHLPPWPGCPRHHTFRWKQSANSSQTLIIVSPQLPAEPPLAATGVPPSQAQRLPPKTMLVPLSPHPVRVRRPPQRYGEPTMGLGGRSVVYWV